MHLRLHWEHQSELRVSQSVMASGPGGGGRGSASGKTIKKKRLGEEKGKKEKRQEKEIPRATAESGEYERAKHKMKS